MTTRDWVQNKLAAEGFASEPVGDEGLAVSTSSRAHPVVVVVPPSVPAVFSARHLGAAILDYPTAEAVVLIRRPADETAFAAASEDGIQLDTFPNVARALESPDQLCRYQHPDEAYLRSRLGRVSAVRQVRRIGLSAWSIERGDGQTTLKIITHNRYEFPASELDRVLEKHPTIRPDAVVITNPNTDGLSTLVTKIAEQQEVRLLLLRDFIDCLARATI